MYDLCIVGAGMVGSAAARHATLIPGLKVCLIGPAEPQNPHERSILGAYYDEGRITRGTATDPLWAVLAQRSIARYRSLEQRTGIHFYEEIGCLNVKPHGALPHTNSKTSGTDESYGIKVIQGVDASRPLRLKFNQDDVILDEKKNAGYIHPRRLVKAEQKAAHLQGCDIISDVVKHVHENNQSNGVIHMKVICQNGMQINAKKILLATGAFTWFRDLLPSQVVPDLELVTQSVILAEVPDGQLQHFKGMPCLLAYFGTYILPPIKYPDGRYYIKLGHGSQFEKTLNTEAEVASWYRSDPSSHIKHGLLKIVHDIFPGFKPASVKYDTCVTSRTPTRRPYIDAVTPRLGVALGGNGYAAKSCDELGRLAIELLIENKWNFPFPKEAVELKCKHHAKL